MQAFQNKDIQRPRKRAPPLQKNLGAELKRVASIRVTEWRIFVSLVEVLPDQPAIWNLAYEKILTHGPRCRKPHAEIPICSIFMTVWNLRIMHVGLVFLLLLLLLLLVVLPTLQFPGHNFFPNWASSMKFGMHIPYNILLSLLFWFFKIPKIFENIALFLPGLYKFFKILPVFSSITHLCSTNPNKWWL